LAERKLGELIRQHVRVGKPAKLSHDGTIRLNELGITRNQSSTFKALAALPEQDFNRYLESRNPTTAGAVRLAREHQTEVRRDRIARAGADAGGNILTGSVQLLWDYLQDDSVDLFFTDPPYDAAGIPTYSELAKLAAAKLKPGALCLAYAGSWYLPEIMARMGEHLDYHWIFCVKFAGRHSPIYPKKIQQWWSAIVGYSKPPAPRVWLHDFVQSQPDSKVKHDWQKPEYDAEHFISKLTKRGQLVVDPFVGSGTTLAVAKRLGRKYLGTELNERTARIARRRLTLK
jgi:hypothetical protein